MSLLNELLFENPMLLETKRFLRKFVGIRAGAVHVLTLIMIVAGYLLLLGVIVTTGGIPPIAVIHFQTGLFCLVLPPMLQGAIAGEREKGTWESLLAAPISRAQIVAGKYWGAVLVVLGLAGLMLPPLLWTNFVGRRLFSPYADAPDFADRLSPGMFLTLEVLSLSFGLLLAAWCLFVSSRSKRSFTAQGVIFGSLLLALVAWPVFLATAFERDHLLQARLCALHPFCVIDAVGPHDSISATDMYGQPIDTAALAAPFGGWFAIFIYVTLIVALLIWTDRTLRYAEPDGAFDSRRSRATH